jgi:hypothetical protein
MAGEPLGDSFEPDDRFVHEKPLAEKDPWGTQGPDAACRRVRD